MVFEDNIKKHNLTLPNAADPVGSYVATKIVGKLLYISGQISINKDGKLITGKLGKDLDTDTGYEAAKRCGLSIVAQAKKACNEDLSKIKAIKSEAPLITLGCSVKSSVELTNPVSLIQDLIFERSSLHAFLA